MDPCMNADSVYSHGIIGSDLSDLTQKPHFPPMVFGERDVDAHCKTETFREGNTARRGTIKSDANTHLNIAKNPLRHQVILQVML